MIPLRHRRVEDMQVRNFSPHTQRAYVDQVARFARYFRLSPDQLDPEAIRAYLVYLTNERHLAPSRSTIAVAALRFLYTVTLRKRWTVQTVIPTPREPQRVPVVLSPAEVVQFLEHVAAFHHRAILTTCYAAGLRISEAVHLTLAAIDSQRMVLRIEQGKGHRDRYVMLSPKLLEILRAWWRRRRPRHWLFPGQDPDVPVTAHAVNCACKVAQRRSGLTKPITPHSLRHAFPGSRDRRAHDSVASGPFGV
jgi:site-specific recombinase XerD